MAGRSTRSDNSSSAGGNGYGGAVPGNTIDGGFQSVGGYAHGIDGTDQSGNATVGGKDQSRLSGYGPASWSGSRYDPVAGYQQPQDGPFGPSVPAPVAGLNPPSVPSLPPMPQDDPNLGRIAGAWNLFGGAPQPTIGQFQDWAQGARPKPGQQFAGGPLPGPPAPKPGSSLPGPPSPKPQPGPPAPKPGAIAGRPPSPDLGRAAGGVSGFTDGASGPERGSNPQGYSGGFEGAGFGSNSYGVNPNMSSRAGFDQNSTVGPTSFGNVPTSGNLANPGGPGGGSMGGGKIICTAMNEDLGFGRFRNAIWMRYSADLDPAYERGYHAIARPVLAWSRRPGSARSLVYRLLQDVARQRTIDIRLEERHGPIRPLIRGRVYRAVLEPLCFVVGKLVRT